MGYILWEPPPTCAADREIGRSWSSPSTATDWSSAAMAIFGGGRRGPEGFWGSIWEFFELRAHAPFETVLASREMLGAASFPGAR